MIRGVLAEHARLSVSIDQVADDADLFRSGMSSQASVTVMLAIEGAFDIEFPDAMLTRKVFETISAIEAAVIELQADA
jgi:acyl carrier protein